MQLFHFRRDVPRAADGRIDRPHFALAVLGAPEVVHVDGEDDVVLRVVIDQVLAPGLQRVRALPGAGVAGDGVVAGDAGVDHQQVVHAGGAEAVDGDLVLVAPQDRVRAPLVGDVEDDLALVLFEPREVGRLEPAIDDGLQAGGVGAAGGHVVFDDRDDRLVEVALDDALALRRRLRRAEAGAENGADGIGVGLGELGYRRQRFGGIAEPGAVVEPADVEGVAVGVVDARIFDEEAGAGVVGRARDGLRLGDREEQARFEGVDGSRRRHTFIVPARRSAISPSAARIPKANETRWPVGGGDHNQDAPRLALL